MGPEHQQSALPGYTVVHLVAHSYLGSLSIALDQSKGSGDKPVLLRRIQLTEQLRSEALQRMACAARDAMALSHENVLPVVDVVLQGDALAIVYEYVEAEPLRSLQSWATHRGLAFPVDVSLRLIIDLLRGVRALHGTLLGWPSAPPFGGLSPDSVLVSKDGRTRLCDPLVASCATLLEGMNLNVAKLAYTAPEQAYATAPLAAPSDVFSCAVMLWELLAGDRLFTGSRPTVERKLLEHDLPHLRARARAERQFSDALLALMDRSLATDPSRRPQSPGAFVAELEQCGHEVAPLARASAFMTELAGARFDQRRMTVRSLPAVRQPVDRSLGNLASNSSGSSGANRRVPLPVEVTGAVAARSPRSSGSLPLASPPAAVSLPPRARVSRTFIPLPDRPSRARLDLPNLARTAVASAGAVAPRVGPAASPLPPVSAEQAARPAEPPLPVAQPAPPSPPAPAEPAPPPLQTADPPFAASPEPAPPPLQTADPPFAASPEPAPPPLQATPPPLRAVPPRASAAPAATPSSEPPLVLPVGTTTMVGLAMPPSLLAANAPFESVLPPKAPLDASNAVVVIPPDPSAPHLSTLPPSSHAPLPIPSRVPTLAPPNPTLRPSQQASGARTPSPALELLPRVAHSGRVVRPSGWSQAPVSARKPRARTVFGGLLAALALGGAVATALWLRSSSSGLALGAAPAAAAPGEARQLPAAALSTGLAPVFPDAPAPSFEAGAPTLAPASDAGTVEAPDAAPGLAPAPLDLAALQLRDEQLTQLFALERRAPLPSCSERLGPRARQYLGVSSVKSQAQLQAARRELLKGNNQEAHRHLCSATLYNPGNIAAWQALAELALHVGDGRQAQQALEQALKRRPDDAALVGLLGDATALLGDLERSRALWAKSVRASASDGAERLATQFTLSGERQLRAWSYGRALAQYRRAAVFSLGGAAASAGMGEALRSLGQPQVAMAWADRAAQGKR